MRFSVGVAAATFLDARPRPAAAAPSLWCTLPSGFAQTPSTVRPAPFSVPLPQPPILRPTASEGDADRYVLEVATAEIEVLPGLSTTMRTYGGVFPGPTVSTTSGREVKLEVHNSTAEPAVVHLHGGVTPAASDGHPLDVVMPGGVRTYRYPNQQPAATLWYHDHVMLATAVNVYRGQAGSYIVRDRDEDRMLGLPDGERDLLLVLTDKAFTADGSLAYDGNSHQGFFGDVVLVNGVPQPFADLAATTYRLRIINASNARRYGLRRDDGRPLLQIGTDGGLLAAPVQRDILSVWPGQRAEILMDLSTVDPGASVVLEDRFASPATAQLVRFDVSSAGPAATALPATLRRLAPVPTPVAQRDIELGFDASTGTWLLNGHGFDAGLFDAYPRLGTVERWRFTNPTSMAHPLHLHLASMRTVTRIGPDGTATPSPPWEHGDQDTVIVGAGETVEVDAHFTQHTGSFVYHCHILEHEDHDMMSQFRVVDLARVAGPGRVETAAALAGARAVRPPVAVVVSGETFADALAAGPAAARLGGPLLLSVGAELHPSTAAALERLQPGRIVVAGGPAAVPEAVLAALRELSVDGQVQRWAGADRYATAAAISAAVFASAARVYVATGEDFPDALAGGAAAAAESAPLLLVTRDTVPEPTARALRRLAPAEVVVLGGDGVVSAAVAEQLAALSGVAVQRRAGTDRYATAAAVSGGAFTERGGAVTVVTGEDFPDALAAVPAVAGGPLLLVPAAGVPPTVAAEILRLAPARIVIVGGAAAVPEAVSDELARLL